MADESLISIVLPVYNEKDVIERVIEEIQSLDLNAEIIAVDDGSSDGTSMILKRIPEIEIMSHPVNQGNGAAIKTGIRAAHGQIIVLMDGDGQHDPHDIPRLVSRVTIDNYDMAVGARTNTSQTALHRDAANHLYNVIASYLVAHRVEDLTSGFRAIRADVLRRFVALLPNGFSYPTTITIAAFRAGYSVIYEPIKASARVGSSKIRLLKDGLGFLLTLARLGTFYVPLRIFVPLSAFLILTGSIYGGIVLAVQSRFSSTSLLLIVVGVLFFMLGLISEQIAMLRLQISDYFLFREKDTPR